MLDRTTETIAHFVGLFGLAVENVRSREAFDEFFHRSAGQPDPAQSGGHLVAVKAPLDPGYFQPNVPYQPVGPDIVKVVAPSVVDYQAQSFFVRGHTPLSSSQPEIHHPTPYYGPNYTAPAIEPVGTVAIQASQLVHLSDNDHLSVGNHGLSFDPGGDFAGHLGALLDTVPALSPLATLDVTAATQSTESLIEFIHSVRDTLLSYDAPGATVDGMPATVFVAHDAETAGVTVNGTHATTAPVFEDYFRDPSVKPADPVKTDKGTHGAEGVVHNGTGASASGGVAAPDPGFTPSVTIDTGSNTLLNQVQIVNNWANSNVIAVVGDHTRLDAITQTNIHADASQIGASLNGWTQTSSPTQTFNIANFQTHDLSADYTPAKTNPGQFPVTWSVTQIDGDLTILNWIKQLSFVSDNDVAMLSSSGVKTTAGTGDNVALNGSSLYELGHYYDLIIVGGSVYDANIIKQTNILLDNDMVGAVHGFQTTGTASVTVGGNLLWNAASIERYEGAHDPQALTKPFQDAAAQLQAGNQHAPSDLLSDSAFEGMPWLRVLYVSGDMINLQYVDQTNILGDSDQIGLAMDQLAPHPEANWTITSGANQLINLASIKDVDYTGKLLVGGQSYSDAMLVQSGLVSSEPLHIGANPDQLVNEAVAFLHDDFSAPDATTPQPTAFSALDSHAAAPSDPMHAVVS